jgi:flavodoxin
MKTLVVYESEYGNTGRIARAIADALGEHGEARALPVGEAGDLTAQSFDLLVVGAPTQRHGAPVDTEGFLYHIPRDSLRSVVALAFDTRYDRARWITGSAAGKIEKHLRRLGCRMLAQAESFFVAGAEGPLEPGEEERARAWALRSLGRTRPAVGKEFTG